MSKWVNILAVVIISAVVTSGCGGSSGESSDTNAKTEASASFMKAGQKNTIATFGTEASPEEREEASKIVEESLQARARGAFAAQCATLSAAMLKEIEESGAIEGNGGGCPNELKGEAEPLANTKALRADTMTGPIDVLRVKGDHAYALYHGAKGINYAIPLIRENGHWKVASLVTRELP